MKMDKEFSCIYRCPETLEQVSWHEYSVGTGTCGKCGHQEKGTFTHAVKVAGKWIRPNLIEWIAGSRPIFLEK